MSSSWSGVSHLATGTNSDNAEKFTPALHHALMQLLVDNNRLGPYLYPRDGRSTGDLLSTPLGNIVDDGPKVLVMYSDDDFYKYDKQAQKWLPGPVAGDTNAGQFWYESYTSGSYTNTVEMHDELPCPRDNPANERGPVRRSVMQRPPACCGRQPSRDSRSFRH